MWFTSKRKLREIVESQRALIEQQRWINLKMHHELDAKTREVSQLISLMNKINCKTSRTIAEIIEVKEMLDKIVERESNDKPV